MDERATLWWLLSSSSAFLDRRSGWIVGECYRVGRNLEATWQPLSESERQQELTDAERRGIFRALAGTYNKSLKDDGATSTDASARRTDGRRISHGSCMH